MVTLLPFGTSDMTIKYIVRTSSDKAYIFPS